MRAFQKRFFKDILCQNDRQYAIPVYQREYSWEKENCKKLFQDICKCAHDDKKHYIGSIVYASTESKDVDECLVIDGQQRITTVILLLKAMLDLIDNTNLEEVKIKNKIKVALYNEDCDEKYKLKLKPIESDNLQLEYILMDGFDNVDAKSNISVNYEYFKKLIIEQMNINHNISYIYDGICNLELVEIILEDDDNPQLIFESINSTGLKLTKADLIRNYLMMNIRKRNEQEEYYKKYWIPLEKRVHKENLEKFFFDFLVMKDKKYISEENIYENFKEYVQLSNFTSYKEIFEELLKYGKYYQLLVCYNNTDYSKKTNQICKDIALLNHNTIYSFLLRICDDQKGMVSFSEEELQKILELFFNYALRRLIIGIPSSSLRRFYSTLYEKIFKVEDNKKEYYKAIESFLCQLRTNDKMPTNIDFKKSLEEINIYKKGAILKFLFDAIENGNQNEKVNFSNLTIEHIMPQKLNIDWKDMLGKNWEIIFDTYLNTLGNLSITGYNSKYSNEKYLKKKELMQKVNTKILILNKEIFDNAKWDEKVIKNRADRLSNLIINKYQYPKDIKQFKFNLSKEVYLDQDITENQGLELYGFNFLGTERKAKYYTNILCEVLEMLYDLEPKILQQLAKDKFILNNGTRINISDNLGDIKAKPKAICNNTIFVETNHSRETILHIIIYILKLYELPLDSFYLIYLNEYGDEG